jgi:endonuclease/exonuclease/phosphatase family metal-dependent hydrolase
MAFCCPAVAFAQDAPDVCADGKCVQIGSYNIELFGNPRVPFNTVVRGPRTEAEIDRLVNLIAKDLDLEVIAFEEINTHSDEWSKFKDKMKALGYQFFEGTASDRNQFVVLAWDADEVQLLGNSAHELQFKNNFDYGDGCAVPGQRKPVAGRFKAGEFDFWVVGVHLKSQLGEASCSDRVRTEQCKELVERTNELITQSGERDVIIVGDFNNRVGHASLQPLADAGFISQMRFLMPQSAKGSFVKLEALNDSDMLIDQLMLRYEDTREVVKNSACIMKLPSREETEKYIVEKSDHVPVWVSFRTDADLDDPN